MENNKKEITVKNDTTTYYKLSMLLGSAALVIDALVMMWTGEFDDGIFVGLLLGLVCLTMSFWQYIGASKETRDERMLRVSTYAITLSWFCTVMIIGYAAILAYYMHVNYNGVQALGFAMFMGIVTMLGWLAYYSTRGDLELPDNL
jgi:cadmium resistance protein CadD (predicted permease)